MKIKKIISNNKWFRKKIRYSHYLNLLIFWINYYRSLSRKIAKDDFINLNGNHISLQVGSSYHLEVGKSNYIIWKSDNHNVEVDQNGIIYARNNSIGKDSRARISACNQKGKLLKIFFITIVDWKTNKSKLDIIDKLPNYNLLAHENNIIYFSISKNLFKTEDSFKTKQLISRLPLLPARSSNLLLTPAGYFLIGERKIVHSLNLKNWMTCLKMQHNVLRHMFDFYYDEISKKTYVFAGEYSCNDIDTHKVYRGIIKENGEQIWSTILDLDSVVNNKLDMSLWFAARHIHNVSIDPYTGNLWVGTGDFGLHPKILYSLDYGDSFEILGLGSQAWRTLSIWFTSSYIYWNMDSHKPQKIFRVTRTKFQQKKTITPKLGSGKTKIGITYLVIEKKDNKFFPVNIGEIYKESESRNLSSKNRVIALDDEKFDFREEVAELANGNHWYNCWIKDNTGDDLLLMGAATEGNIRDYHGRLFGIRELEDNKTDIQELISINSKNPNKKSEENKHTQVEPILQDNNGYVYLKCRNTFWNGIFKTKIKWKGLSEAKNV